MLHHGFLGNDASLMLDVVVCALILVVPTLLYSLYVVRFRRRYLLHRNLQVTLGVVLLVAVGAFEIDLQLVHGGWENVVNKPGEEPRMTLDELDSVRTLLWVHLVFAVSTPFFWAATLVLAWRRFPNPPTPGEHSRMHKVLGWISTIDITLTSITGLIFYYATFVR